MLVKSWSKATQKMDKSATASQLQIEDSRLKDLKIAPQASPSGANIKMQSKVKGADSRRP
ncbi:hypothetical protein CEE36_03070 [candidate division TA06 bacterium B3_TA06]|uniref:Uncharacterized protein n=1 Tax=candidate division TA06 bacterium B3_TA06 TaxID=2012487 RepID=A0A532V960_UNCT6|nr:MAG: hypothetical protein CEE36_03070 [candidate division TA06 bacterium B3_TA06]